MSVCIPTCMLSSGLIAGGMRWWQAICTIVDSSAEATCCRCDRNLGKIQV